MTQKLARVRFAGQSLVTIKDHDDIIYVAMRPIVEGMGLNWKSQWDKLKDHRHPLRPDRRRSGQHGPAKRRRTRVPYQRGHFRQLRHRHRPPQKGHYLHRRRKCQPIGPNFNQRRRNQMKTINLPTLKVVNGVPYASSLDIADRFGVKHQNVLRAIAKCIGELKFELATAQFADSEP
ncbi:MAG: hypothetical protein IT173_12495 [Acidobacteria bacterium]|nr:hypothetical protein [Acidobacteriota bacterium]